MHSRTEKVVSPKIARTDFPGDFSGDRCSRCFLRRTVGQRLLGRSEDVEGLSISLSRKMLKGNPNQKRGFAAV